MYNDFYPFFEIRQPHTVSFNPIKKRHFNDIMWVMELPMIEHKSVYEI